MISRLFHIDYRVKKEGEFLWRRRARPRAYDVPRLPILQAGRRPRRRLSLKPR
jgi:hypothetical protein